MDQLIFIGGLPGSGKSWLVEELRRDGYRSFDDFQREAVNHSPDFVNAREYPNLVGALQSGARCVVADVRVVVASYRQRALELVRRDVGEIPISWRIYENDPTQCEANVRRDAAVRSPEGRLRIIREFTLVHSGVPGVPLRPVWRGE